MRHAIAVAALLSLAGDADARPGEMRGLWVVRTALVSPESVDRVVELAANAGFNALFVQVRGRGDAFYASGLVSRSALLERQPASFDPLDRLLEQARARGLEVHAWFNVLLTAHFPTRLPGDHVLSRHPEWVMVPREIARVARRAGGKELLSLVREASRDDPDVEGYYLSPSSPGVAAHLVDAVRELAARYPVDGLHWDFIRYPGPRYDYSRWALQGFREWRGGGDLHEGPEDSPAAWATYRRGVLNSLARRLGEAARQVRPGVVVSAAVVPEEAAAVHHKFQAWPAWVDRGIIDAICPMAYTTSPEIFRRQVAHAQQRAGAEGKVWAGIGSYRLPLADSIDRIRTARQMGAEGVVLYSHESFGPADLQPLRQAFGSTGVALELTGSGTLRGAAPGR
jgi:uncharacterized lipoprotein YddW (UPF0748 family)